MAKRPLADFIPGEVLVRFRPDASFAKNESRIATTLMRIEEGRAIPMTIERSDHVEIVEGLRVAHVAPEETLSAIATLNSRPDVLYAEPNYVRRKDATPNDSRYGEQWALKNTGQAGGTNGADIHAEQAWETTTGSRNVVVGVVDEGIDINHPDLQSNIWTNPAEVAGNSVDDDADGYVDDVHGYDFFHDKGTVYDGTPVDNNTDAHGTHVAGTIGAASNNNQGVAGVNWQVSLMSLKILGKAGEAAAPSSVRITLRAYSYAKTMRDLWVSSGGTKGANVRVLNNSYGGEGRSQAEFDAINALNDSGILFVAAAGNDSTDNDVLPHYPAGYDAPNVISVMATDRYGYSATFSNYGMRSVHIAAPGQDILSTTPNGTYSTFSGTSMAAPHVSGAAALLCAVYPNLSVGRLRAALLFGGNEATLSDLPSKNITNRILDINGALQNAAINDATPPAAVGNLRILSRGGLLLTLGWTAPGDDGNTGRASIYQLRFTDSDFSNAAQFDAARPLVVSRPGVAGTTQSTTVTLPYRHTSGFIGIRAVDKAGNTGPIVSLGVSVDVDIAEPYVVTETSAPALSTGGTPLGLKADDKYSAFYALPFEFPFFGNTRQSIRVSTNGGLYFSSSVGREVPTTEWLNGQEMVAGLWDDLRTDRRDGDDVYVVKPDADRIIFRWQAVTYDTQFADGTTRGENPVSFEIELRRDGTIQTRYGDGNRRMFPIVGISAGQPDAYVVDSHTSEFSLKDLTNAPAVAFTPRALAIVAPVRFDPDGATSAFAQDVRVTCQTPGAIIHYTTNGIDPTENDPVVLSGSSIHIDRTLKLKARAFKTGLVSSAIKSADFIITTPAPTPTPAPSSFNKIAYSGTSGFGGDVFVMNVDGSNKINLTNFSHQVAYNNVSAGNGAPKWSPDGSKIVFISNRDGALKIYVMNADGTGQTNISGNGFGDRTDDAQPSWSADGRKILFINKSSSGSQICTMNPDGTNRIRLTSSQIFRQTPAWSPDGAKIVYTVSRYDGGADVYTMNADGTGETRLTNDTIGKESPAWSPDSKRIVFASTRDGGINNKDIYVMNADGSNWQRLTSGSGNEVEPVWSPDGTKIAFSIYRYDGSPQQIYLMNADGGGQVNISNSQTGASGPAWHPLAVTSSLPTNPINDAQFFVRQHYLDFLNREPDQGGWDYWTSAITGCNGDPRCINSKRVGVSAAFFIEQEFQETGGYVYRFYKASYGQQPTFAQFMPDRSKVVGGANLESGKQAFADQWVQQPEFLAKYPANMQPGDFIDQLVATVKATTGGTVDLSGQRANLLATLQTNGRGAAVLQVAENAAFKQAEYNKAFVLMQYFGYLRRDPDQGGYNFWLDILNNRVANNYRSMVCAFITSAEYQLRFGSTVTRTDAVCGSIGQ